MIRRAAVLLALAAASCSPASAESIAPGVYGNVSLSEVSGDLGGMELELIGTGPDARVEFVICEGWCNMLTRATVRFTDEGLEFEHVDQYQYSDGSPAPKGHYLVQAVAAGSGLRVTVTPADKRDQAFTEVLPRIDERFGLAVAAGEE